MRAAQPPVRARAISDVWLAARDRDANIPTTLGVTVAAVGPLVRVLPPEPRLWVTALLGAHLFFCHFDRDDGRFCVSCVTRLLGAIGETDPPS